MIKKIILIIILILSNHNIFADTIILNNGKSIEGNIVEEANNLEKYTNSKYGFSIFKPKDWRIVEETDDFLKNNQVPGVKVICGFTKEYDLAKSIFISIGLRDNPKNEVVPEKYVEIMKASSEPFEKNRLGEPEVTILDNGQTVVVEAVQIPLPGYDIDMHATTTYFFGNEKIYVVGVMGFGEDLRQNAYLIDKIINSFKIL